MNILLTLLLQAAEEADKDLPWYVFLAGSLIVPLAVLWIASFVVNRGGGGGH